MRILSTTRHMVLCRMLPQGDECSSGTATHNGSEQRKGPVPTLIGRQLSAQAAAIALSSPPAAVDVEELGPPAMLAGITQLT